jgi:hypothetical protein
MKHINYEIHYSAVLSFACYFSLLMSTYLRFIKYYSDDKIKEDDVGGTCSTRTREIKNSYNILGRDYLEDLGIDGNES